MPIKHCEKNGSPGYSWGNTKKCWTYDPKNEASRKKAKQNCLKQGYAESPEKFKKEMAKSTDITKEEILEAQISVIFDKSDDTEEPSEETMMCPDCNEPMDEKEDMMVCGKCGKEIKKE